MMKACDEDHPPNCHPAEALSGVEGAVEGSAVFSLSRSQPLGAPSLRSEGGRPSRRSRFPSHTVDVGALSTHGWRRRRVCLDGKSWMANPAVMRPIKLRRA